MTEHEAMTTASETVPTPTTEQKSAKKKAKGSKVPSRATENRTTQKTSSLTDEQKREARNAALREWRKKNKDRYAAYMADWRAKKKREQPRPASSSGTTPNSAPKKPTSPKKSKKGGKA